MVEVFKTNVEQQEESVRILEKLRESLPGGTISFDLDDCDKVLRIEDAYIPKVKIVLLLNSYGYHCEILQ